MPRQDRQRQHTVEFQTLMGEHFVEWSGPPGDVYVFGADNAQSYRYGATPIPACNRGGDRFLHGIASMGFILRGGLPLSALLVAAHDLDAGLSWSLTMEGLEFWSKIKIRLESLGNDRLNNGLINMSCRFENPRDLPGAVANKSKLIEVHRMVRLLAEEHTYEGTSFWSWVADRLEQLCVHGIPGEKKLYVHPAVFKKITPSGSREQVPTPDLVSKRLGKKPAWYAKQAG